MLAIAVLSGIGIRLILAPWTGSDVVAGNDEALDLLRAGLNPYAQTLAHTNPPGGYFPYPPGELAFYAIQRALFGTLAAHDHWWGIAVMLLFAVLGPVAGYSRCALAAAIYGMCPISIAFSSDGSNDTALSLLVFAGVALLLYGLRAPRPYLLYASAVTLGWALAFKHLAWLVVPFAIWWVPPPRRTVYAAIALGVFALFCLPFFVWNPLAFAHGLATAQGVHATVFGYNVWAILQGRMPDAALAGLSRFSEIFDGALVIATAWFVWPRTKVTLGDAIARGAAVLAVAVLFARWSSLAYYNYVVALACLAIATSAASQESSRPLSPAPPAPQS